MRNRTYDPTKMPKRRGFLRRRREESTEKPPIDPSALIDPPAQYAISQFGIDPSALIDPSAQYAISQFDIVRVLATDETESGGYAGRTGTCYGYTTPSVTNVEVVGGTEANFAFSVQLEDVEGEVWFAPDLLELVDHDAGTTIEIGGKTFVRRADGEWDDTTSEDTETT
jgi:hypothetical protein